MPRIELLDIPLFSPEDSYHFEFDNLPLKNLMRRQNLINNYVDTHRDILNSAIGDQGSLAARLAVSLNDNGSLRTSAVDEAMHSIEDHVDTDDYVRMTKSQSDKLDLISDEASDITFQIVDGDGDEIDMTEGIIRLLSSNSLTWSVDGNEITPHLGFPLSAAHRHIYDQKPIVLDEDTNTYKVDTSSTAFIQGSLRVFVNGVRVPETRTGQVASDNSIYVPGDLLTDSWTLLTFTSEYASGTFALSVALDDGDILRVDYDIPFVE